MLKKALTFLAFLLIGYLFIVGLITLLQNQLIFHPAKELWATPDHLNMTWSDHRIETPDSIRLHGWMIGDPEGQPVVVYSHGNAGNISGRVDIAGAIAKQGAAVFLYDYRGYGRSEGSPTEEGIYTDGKAVVHYLRDELNISTDRLVFFGRSLGATVAARQAAEFEGAGLVLDSAFLNGKEIAMDIYPFIPGFLVGIDFPVDEDLRRSATEYVMIIHAKNDRIIPFRHGEQLYRIANNDSSKTVMFVELRGGHNTSFIESREVYARKWSEFLSKIDGNQK